MPPSPAVLRILSWQKLQASTSPKLPTDSPWMLALWAWAQSSIVPRPWLRLGIELGQGSDERKGR